MFPAHAQTGIWACTPLYWVNLGIDGPDVNTGVEPPFILQITTEEMRTTGKESWLNNSVFLIEEELTLGDSKFVQGATGYHSQLIFNVTRGEFFHSTAHAGIAVSMVGTCNRG